MTFAQWFYPAIPAFPRNCFGLLCCMNGKAKGSAAATVVVLLL